LHTLKPESTVGETHTSARFSLQLEADRLKRDLERVEDELGVRGRELEEREARRGRGGVSWMGCNAENRS